MNKSATHTDLKVGIFVSIGLGLILAAILVLGSTESLLTRKNRYFTHFQAVDGLIQGAKVVIGGVLVGTIESTGFDLTTRNIKVTYTVSKDATVWVKSDSTVEVMTQGVMGDKYLSINAGSPEQAILPDGAEIPFRAGKDLMQFLSKGDNLMVSLNSIATTLDRVLKNFESAGRSEAFFAGLATTSKNLAVATERLKTELAQGGKLTESLAAISSILEKIDNGSGTVGALINDPSLYDDLKSLLGGANRNRIIRNLVRETINNNSKTPPAASTPAQ